MEDKCQHFIPKNGTVCTQCGEEMPVVELEAPELEDMIGIIRLIDTTVGECLQVIEENTDPINPNLPRLRLIGGTFIRTPHETLVHNLAIPSFAEAKSLGYRGGVERWEAMLYNALLTDTEDEPETDS
jgi:hypothetical protein